MKLAALTITFAVFAILGCGDASQDIQKLFEPKDAGSEAVDSGAGGEGGSTPDSGIDGEGGADTGPCVPKSESDACGVKDCGSAWDGCTGSIDCGMCTLPQVCGGLGVPGQCGCTPVTKIVACTGRNCGPVSNACGGTYSCGTCSLPETCEGQTPVIPGVCGCTPKAPAAVCGSKTCGTAPDGCGGTVSCGTCTGDTVCGAVTPDHCDLCPNDQGKLTVGQSCPNDHPIPRQCPNNAYKLPDCEPYFFSSGTTPFGQYCCTL